MRHGLDLMSRKSVRRWSPKKKWNSRHIYLGKTCKAFDMRWLNMVSFKKAKKYSLTHPVLAVYRAESGRRLVLNLMEDKHNVSL